MPRDAEPLTISVARERDIRQFYGYGEYANHPAVVIANKRTSELLEELDATREALSREREALKVAQKGCRVAYQFCSDRGANDELLMNLDAAADNEPIPHPEWPVNDGKWKWDDCKHEAHTACGECLNREWELTRELLGALAKARSFMECARFELEEKHTNFEQFPCQMCADKYLGIVDAAIVKARAQRNQEVGNG